MNLLRLSHLLGDETAREMAGRTLARYGPRAGRAGRVIPFMLADLSAWHAGIGQVIVVGDPANPATLALKAELGRHYLPFVVVVPVVPDTNVDGLTEMMPLVRPMAARSEPTAFVCRDFVCREPVTTAAALAGQLGPAA